MKKSALVQGTKSAKRMLTVKETAQQLGISEKTVWAKLYSKQLPKVQIFGSVRIPSDLLEAFIEEMTIPAGEVG